MRPLLKYLMTTEGREGEAEKRWSGNKESTKKGSNYLIAGNPEKNETGLGGGR